jgi:hypothetical protein
VVYGDVPLLDAASMPPPPAVGRPSRVLKRIDYAALTQHAGVLDAELARLHEPVVRRFQEFLDGLAGEACPARADNGKLIALVNDRADRLGIRLTFSSPSGEAVVVRLKFASGVFEARTPGRGGSLAYSGAAFSVLVAVPAVAPHAAE